MVLGKGREPRVSARPSPLVPVQTPSLRKENKGQDVSVSLVPTKGGWGSKDKEDEPKEEDQAEAKPEAKPEPKVKPKAPAWSGEAPKALKPQADASPSGGSRWGDDAVEDDEE